MKVLHVLQSNRYAGAENVACTIIKMFQQSQENIEFFYISPNGKIKEILDKEKIKFIPIKKLSYLQLKKIIDEIKPDIIHAHDFKSSVLCSFFYKKSNPR